jgi:UDP-glucose 4-epimerase
MIKVLVTGGCGFIGSQVVDMLLQHNYEVTVIDNLSNGKRNNINLNAVDFVHCNIRSNEFHQTVEQKQPDCIIHLAVQPCDSDSLEDVENACNASTLDSLYVMDVVKRCGVKEVIFASSTEVYGEADIDSIQTKLNPNTPMGISKVMGEMYLKFLAEKCDMKYTILRIGNTYDWRQTNKGHTNDLIKVADVSKTILAALKTDEENKQVFHATMT